MSECLPSGWVTTTLGDICLDRVAQGVPTEKPVPYVDIGSIDRCSKQIGDTEFVTDASAPTRARQWVRKGDVLVSMTQPNLNAVAKVGPELDCAVASTGFDVLRPLGIAPEWIYYRVRTNEFIADVCEDLQGVVYPAIRPRDVRRHELPLPSLTEQHRIVEAIESYLTRLDDAMATLERVQRNLKRYRASVLKAAAEGSLVPTEAELARAEGREYEPASLLLERILAERRRRWEEAELAKMKAKGKEPRNDKWKAKYVEPEGPDTRDLPELPEGWCWATVDQLSVVVRGASPRPAGHPRYFGGSIPWITVGDLTRDSSPYLTKVPGSVTEAGKNASRFIEAGTLLLTNSGATLGVPKITRIGGCINDGSVALLGVGDQLKLYLLYFLRTRTSALRSINQGTAQPNLNTTIVKSIAVPLPPSAEQLRIIQSIEEMLDVVESLDASVGTNQARSTRLRQSILKWAFEGRLVDQDPSDEPAEVLLERIRAERTTKPARSTRQRRQAAGAGEKRL